MPDYQEFIFGNANNFLIRKIIRRDIGVELSIVYKIREDIEIPEYTHLAKMYPGYPTPPVYIFNDAHIFSHKTCEVIKTIENDKDIATYEDMFRKDMSWILNRYISEIKVSAQP